LVKNCKQTLTNSFIGQKNFCSVHANMCFYDVLGVKQTVGSADLKKAYYDKVKKFHPDHNKTEGAEESFKVVSRAYEILKDPDLRKTYDLSKNAQGFTASEFSSKASASHQSNSNSNQYQNAYQQQGYSHAYGHQQAWEEHHHRKRAEEAMRNQQYQSSQSTNQSIFDRFSVRLGVVVGVFFFLDLWRRQNQPAAHDVLPVIEAGSFTPQIDAIMTKQQLTQEIKNKQFRVEYQMAPVNYSPETVQAQKTYKKEKKVAGLDAFVEKQNFTLQKSQDLFSKVN